MTATDVEPMSKYRHPSTCDSRGFEKMVNTDFVDVIRETAERAEFEVDWGAAGCGTCFETTADGALYWVAQNEAVEKMYVKHSHNSDQDPAYLASLLAKVADEKGLDVSATSDADYSVVLGERNYYTDLEPGTRVRKDGLEGIVLDPSWVEPTEFRWAVVDDHGEEVGRFRERSTAKFFASVRNLKTREKSTAADEPGRNPVMFDGARLYQYVRTSNLDEYDLRTADDSLRGNNVFEDQ